MYVLIYVCPCVYISIHTHICTEREIRYMYVTYQFSSGKLCGRKHVRTRIFPELRAGSAGGGEQDRAPRPLPTPRLCSPLCTRVTSTRAILYPPDLVCYEHFSKSFLCRTMPFLTALPRPRREHLCTRACFQLLGAGSGGAAPRADAHRTPTASAPARVTAGSSRQARQTETVAHVPGGPHRRHARSEYGDPFP